MFSCSPPSFSGARDECFGFSQIKGGSDFESGTGQNDVFVFNAGYGALEVNQWNNDPTSDNSVLKLGAGISAASTSVFTTDGSEIMLTDGVTGDQIQIDGMYSSANSGVSAIEFADGTVWTRAQILAMAPYDGASGYAETLKGNTGNNIFDSEGSKDKETGAGGDDTYLLKAGYNTVTIVNGIAANNVAEGDLSIANMNPDNIWLQQVGNNLQIDIMGSKTEATIQGWFTNTYNQLSEITVSGGSGGNMTLDTQVSQLVQAMATYSADHTAFNPQASANPQITDPTLLSAVSTAWHHA